LSNNKIDLLLKVKPLFAIVAYFKVKGTCLIETLDFIV